MGWLKLGRRTPHKESPETWEDDLKYTTEHIESVQIGSSIVVPLTYPHVPRTVSDDKLPFIPSSEVVKRVSPATGGLFIVVDDIVYDCTNFISEHPGGDSIIQSFAGAECSWQFWRFHGKSELEQFGKPLRVGRTSGLVNRFREPEKFVGLRKLGDDWD